MEEYYADYNTGIVYKMLPGLSALIMIEHVSPQVLIEKGLMVRVEESSRGLLPGEALEGLAEVIEDELRKT
jgi:hypothetical protein